MSSTYIRTKQNAGFARTVLKSLGVVYFLGLLMAIAYVWLLTQDRYVSKAAFKISRQEAGSGLDTSVVQLALPGIADSGSMDSQVTIGYINSADLLLDLEKQFNLIEHFSSPSQDFVFRMDPNGGLEDRLKFYRKHITADFNHDTGLTEINVDTFTPALSQEIAAAVLKRAEGFVNLINQDVADQQLEFIRGEVDRTSERVNEVHRELIELQNKHRFISPSEVINASLAAVQEMQMERFRAEAELASLLRDSPESPRIDNLESRLRSLNELIDKETTKLSGPERDRLNQILMEFKEIELRLETATRLRTGAEMLLEKNRIDAVARSRFFSVIQTPYLPEEVALPLRTYTTITMIFLGVLCFFIVRALVHSVHERS
jgi:capsular polysaccharide transport system permease protein